MRKRGFVLPVVLVMLSLVSVAVLYLSRQGILDELLARNDRQISQLDAAAQYTLRYCERWLRCAPPGLPAGPGCPVAPAISPNPQAAISANLLTYGNTISAADLIGTIGEGTTAQCLFEDASSHLLYEKQDSGNLAGEAQWGKFIVTAVVTRPSPFILGTAEMVLAQSELRLLLSGI
jgi:hypothetical protein